MKTGSLIYAIICGVLGVTFAGAYIYYLAMHFAFFAILFLVLSFLMYKDFNTGKHERSI